MKANTNRRYGGWSRLCRILALCLALMFLVPAVQTPFGGGSDARAESRKLELELIQTQPEEGFLMIPGAPMPQDITVRLGETSGPCYVYVQVREENNENDYLIYQMADGWQQLQDAEGASVSGVYYRLYDQQAAVSWPVLANQEIMVNPETLTWPVMEQLAADISGASWPFLGYTAYGIELEDTDGAMTPYDGWYILNSNQWRVVVDPRNPDAGMENALGLAEGLSLDAFDVSLQDANGNHMQPQSPVQVKLPVADGADSAVVLHVLGNNSRIIEAISAGRAIALQTAEAEVTIVEVIEAEAADGYAVFEASSFSEYYVVSGHNETLKSWWQDSSGGTTESNTRYNVDRNIYGFDSSDTDMQTFYVEPDSTIYLHVKDGSAAVREITENTSGGSITLSGAANDPAGMLVKVSAAATDGQSMTFTVNDRWTVKIIVTADVVEGTFDNADYPVYVGITFDPTKIAIANEPRVSGNDTNDWTYITDMSSLTMTGSSSSYKQKDVIAPVADSKATDYLLASIKDQAFLEGTDDDSVKGLIDIEMATNDGYPPTIELNNFVYAIEWQKIAQKLLSDSNISSKIKATDGQTPQMATYGQIGGYVLQPYVVKLQTSKYVGWHIDACFVPVRDEGTQWMNFDENLPEGAYIDYLNVPLRKPLQTGSSAATTSLMYSVQPGGTDYKHISESEYITLSDGRKLRFIGWNTQPDGTGCQYPGQGATYKSPSNDAGYWGNAGAHDHNNLDQIASIKAKNPFLSDQTGTMYAFWSAIAERLELHKVVESDETPSGSQSFTFNLTITSLDGVQLSQDGKDKIVFELYDAATDTLVDNSKDNNTALAVNSTVTIRMNANQYAAIFLPTGTQYKIEEIPIPTNYVLVNSVNAEGTIGGKGNDGNVIFTNSYNSTKGFLNLEKFVAGEEADPEQLFSFDVTFDDSEIAAGKSNDVEFTLYNELDESVYDTSERVTVNADGKRYTVLLKHNERIVFRGLEEGTTYTIVEAAVENYSTSVKTQIGNAAATTVSGPTVNGAIEEDQFANVEYTNSYNPPETDGTLTITKAFDGCTPEPGESFVFTVKDASNNIVGEVVIYGAGEKILTLPYGQYTVAEDDSWSWRYEASVSPSRTVEISSATKNPTVTFTNTKAKNNWLDGSAGATNDFGDKAVTTHGGEQ